MRCMVLKAGLTVATPGLPSSVGGVRGWVGVRDRMLMDLEQVKDELQEEASSWTSLSLRLKRFSPNQTFDLETCPGSKPFLARCLLNPFSRARLHRAMVTAKVVGTEAERCRQEDE